MLIPLKEIVNKYKLNITGVIQVGAHYAEEDRYYNELGIKNKVYIEPCKDAFEKIKFKLFQKTIEINYNNINYSLLDNILLIKSACGEENKTDVMYVSSANEGQSNSLLEPDKHLQQHPEIQFSEIEIVEVRTLDFLLCDKFDKKKVDDLGVLLVDIGKCNLLTMDVQGAEGFVLKGAIETLKQIDCIYTEVNRDSTYKGNMLIEEMDEYLKPFGFERVETQWASENLSWGDAVFIKRKK